MRHRTSLLLLVLLLTAVAAMRVAWLRSDPPVAGSVGIVWHDEGAWVHNARNRALFGEWQSDNWNPLYIAPVFTALEYVSFATLGVGTWQARVVPALSGVLAVVFLIAGLRPVVGRRGALLGGALLGLNYAFVMWNRAALMESTMTMWLVAAWAAYARATTRPAWGAAAGVATVAAWFTKASAAFFVAALVCETVTSLAASKRERAPGAFVLAGLAAAFLLAGAVFVWPNWTEYQFYNWQMTVTRKPEYTLQALADRATWIPVVQSVFARMWIELTLGTIGLLSVLARWRTAAPAERLLVWWIALGLAELVVHDSGNERRYVMFIPAFVALAATVVARAWPESDGATTRPLPRPLVASLAGTVALTGASAVAAYVTVGSALRPLFLSAIDAGALKVPVRISLAAAATAGLLCWWRAARVSSWLAAPRLSQRLCIALIAAAAAIQLWQYGRWVASRSETNYEASVALGRLLPSGTLVQGKLANGLSLENEIRPLFVGNGFGNYEDRLRRDDARYILTYDLPRVGYESSDGSGLIQGILQHYPRHRIVASFPVDETPLSDRAVLIDKDPDEQAGHARDQ